MSGQEHGGRARRQTMSEPLRVANAFVLPVAAAAIVGSLLAAGSSLGTLGAVAPLATLALVSWFLGLRWYGLAEMGLRGGRPLFASIGFAAIAWLAVLLLRFFLVHVEAVESAAAGQSFAYLLLFEAFAVQLWTFGLLFHSVADWRGPLTAAISSGIVFGMTAFLLFRESFVAGLAPAAIVVIATLLYFVTWGVLYGIIRLRTGSLLGAVLVQALQSFTAWTVLAPQPVPDAGELRLLYLASVLVFLLLIWRLWPRREGDYRI